MVEGANLQIGFEAAEGGFNLGQLHIEFPELFWIVSVEIGAQQIMAIARLGLLKLLFVQTKREGLARDRFARFRQTQLDELKRPPRLGFGSSQPQQQLVSAGRTLL